MRRVNGNRQRCTVLAEIIVWTLCVKTLEIYVRIRFPKSTSDTDLIPGAADRLLAFIAASSMHDIGPQHVPKLIALLVELDNS